MNETVVTLQGWLGADVTLREAGEVPVASFRVACTPRRYQRRTDSWVDGDTQWYTVTAWRALADNCARSLRRGDPVVVHGRLSAQTWTSSAGIEVTSFEVDAAFVGHDLNRGVAQFTRTARPAAEDAAGPGPDAEPGPDAAAANAAGHLPGQEAGQGVEQGVGQGVEQGVEEGAEQGSEQGTTNARRRSGRAA